MTGRTHVVRLRPRSAAAIAITSVVGVLAFGWPLMLTDVLGLVEQAVLAQTDYFYAHAMSSFAGGTINMRAAAGLDPRTAVID